MGSPKRFVRITVGGRELEMHGCTVDEVCRMVALLWPPGTARHPGREPGRAPEATRPPRRSP